MNSNLIKHILIYSGVTVRRNPKEYSTYFDKLPAFFLTPDNKKWFKERYSESLNTMSTKTKNNHPKLQFLFWELFSFNVLDAFKNEEAIKLFEELNVNKCHLLQLTEYNLCLDFQPSYCLKGEYNVSLIDDEDKEMLFGQLKEFIRQDTSIPYWVIDAISSAIGKEIYVFDDNMNWVLVLTHENEVYLYKSPKN